MIEPTELLIRMPVVLLALTVHEFSHAYVAYRMGDPTALRAGRCTLNPLAHLDLIGTICIMFGPIGWAKPVPVNPYNFRRPLRDEMIVSAAGPVSNVIQAVAFALLLRMLVQQDLFGGTLGREARVILVTMAYVGVLVNCGLAVFNMLPVFPLDGFHVVRFFLGPANRRSLDQTAPYGNYVILALVLLPFLTRGRISPLSAVIRYPVQVVLTYVAGL